MDVPFSSHVGPRNSWHAWTLAAARAVGKKNGCPLFFLPLFFLCPLFFLPFSSPKEKQVNMNALMSLLTLILCPGIVPIPD
jgi:hypothetical protein